ncbi:MAG: ferredoxin [Desulfosarcina sp.]|jgi:ferredoxin
MKIPVVDIGICTLCMGCVELCPDVFQENEAGYIQVVEMDDYPETAVNEAIKYCPVDCIVWEAL